MEILCIEVSLYFKRDVAAYTLHVYYIAQAVRDYIVLYRDRI